MRLILAPGQITELRALNAKLAGDYRPGTVSGYFDDIDKLAAAAASIRCASGVYFVPNIVNPALLARAHNRIRQVQKESTTSDADIIARRWMLIDVDPMRPAGISSTDSEHQAALAVAQQIADHLRGEGWTDPLMGDSGNGGHLLYRIDLPTADGSIVQRCLAALASQFNTPTVKVDTDVFNPARIWKLYGTVACKGDSTPERPHRLARILSKLHDPQ